MAPKVCCPQPPPDTSDLIRQVNLTPQQLAAEEKKWQKDVPGPGKAICPYCKGEFGYGPGGIINLIGQHQDTQNCIDLAAKRDKKPRANGSVLVFFQKKVPSVPPTVRAPSPVRSTAPMPRKNPAQVTARTAALPSSNLSPHILALLHQLRDKTRRLPLSTPEADETSPLAVFSNNPASYVGEAVEADRLWEELAPVFHKAFDYGRGPEERVSMIQMGPHGLGGFLRFMEYFVERGLEGAMAELKLEQLLEAMDLILQKHALRPDKGLREDGSHGIIDIDADAPRPKSPAAPEVLPCSGFVFPHSLDYPFKLHDALTMPWGFEYSNGVLALRSFGCARKSRVGHSNCSACAFLPQESTLAGILKRADEGTHENTNYAYYGSGALIELLRRKDKRIQELRLRGLSLASKTIVQARSLSDYKRLVKAIGSGAVERVDRVVGIALRRKRGVRGILRIYDDAARGVYHPKSYTEEDDMRGLLIWRLAGNRVSDIVHRSLGLPSRSTLRTREMVPELIPSPGKPQVTEVAQNVQACFESITEVIAAKKVVHQVLMLDELATQKRIRWDHKTNSFLGVCREHAHKISLQFNSEQDLEELFRGLLETPEKEAEVHYAGEATVAALGILSDETRLYAARPVLVSGDCKKETGAEHLRNVLRPTLDGVNSKQDLTKLRVVSIASDGELRRGKAFMELTFVHELSPDSNIYPLLHTLPHMNFWVGEDDLTANKDPKHVIKRDRNWLLRKAGLSVMGFEITPAIIRAHLQSAGHFTVHINSLFNPEDKQNVRVAFQLLQNIWALPAPPPTCTPGFRAASEALRLLGAFFYHLVFPYICVDLTLSEQLEHLSAAAYLGMLMYRDDIMIMIKDAYFCVAKAKVDDPTGKFWLILLGTDRLEELFGILRTMIGNDANLDILQLIGRLVGTTQVANILAKYPQWDRPPRRLNLPALARDSTELSDKIDHIKPPSWRGDTSVDKVTLHTCWKRGRRRIEKEFPALAAAFRALDAAANVDILAPLGIPLVGLDLDDDDNEDEDEPTPPSTTSLFPDLEDALVDEEATGREPAATASRPLRKTRALSMMQKYSHKAVSTDRIRRIAGADRYGSRSDEQDHIAEHDSAFGGPCILLSEPIVTLVRCEGQLFVCVGEVTNIIVNGKSVEELGLDLLQEQSVTVRFQIVRVVPATQEDDPELKKDWRAAGLVRNSLAAPGRLVLPINPALSTRVVREPYYLFESTVLRAFGARLFDMIPKFVPTEQFPYREALGRACFVCEGDGENEALLETDPHVCPKCTPSLPLDMAHPQTILAHVGSHILHDPSVDPSTQPCGLCLRPSGMCKFYLKKSGSAANTLTLNMAVYGTAEVSKESSPCSNVPLRCKYCNPKDPAVWRYNFREHLIQQHPNVSLATHSHIWELSDAEKVGMQKVWEARDKRKKPKKPKHPLVISQAHSSRRALAVEERESDVDEDGESAIDNSDNESSLGVRVGPPPLNPMDDVDEFPDTLMPRSVSSPHRAPSPPPSSMDPTSLASLGRDRFLHAETEVCAIHLCPTCSQIYPLPRL
ncbi:hypothetical protein C8R46DRAFT_1309168 [Mycena filopes]|nr:hypothetical protein C8R46DRAFT_1309168 [Mycena filopes]